jgi:hypothetical protein
MTSATHDGDGVSAGIRWVESRARKLLHGAGITGRLGRAAILRGSLPRPVGRDPGGPATADSIVILGTGYIGDVVLATPTLRALRQAFPSSEITLSVEERIAELMAESPLHDRLLPITETRMDGLIDLALRLREARPDIAVALPHTVDAALFA